MEPIFDKDGKTVAWLLEDTVRDLAGHPAAFIRGEDIFDYYGRHLGRLHDGYFWARGGAAVAFFDHHRRAPLTPPPELPPPPPWRAIPPAPPLAHSPPLAPLPTLSWSPRSWP